MGQRVQRVATHVQEPPAWSGLGLLEKRTEGGRERQLWRSSCSVRVGPCQPVRHSQERASDGTPDSSSEVPSLPRESGSDPISPRRNEKQDELGARSQGLRQREAGRRPRRQRLRQPGAADGEREDVADGGGGQLHLQTWLPSVSQLQSGAGICESSILSVL